MYGPYPLESIADMVYQHIVPAEPASTLIPSCYIAGRYGSLIDTDT